eukprot:TRINITY_DN53063_c0_g1_i7.p1 TRINITY_DN53063_c0_g1~~TRINITY_DN53063_c0_g1_i7.p1  ORF type:complete len:181 (-),score=16.65 TRINITY_DN53063_c0_g1_i7:11-553(-)
MTSAQGVVISPIPQSTPTPDVPQVGVSSSATSEPQKMTYADAVSGPRRTRVSSTQVKPKISGPVKPAPAGTVPNGVGYRKRIPQTTQTTQTQATQTQTQAETETTETGEKVQQNPIALKLGVNPETFDINPTFARFFVIKSYSAEDVHKSIKYGVWTSTKQIGRAVQQECRDRSRMPSSA